MKQGKTWVFYICNFCTFVVYFFKDVVGLFLRLSLIFTYVTKFFHICGRFTFVGIFTFDGLTDISEVAASVGIYAFFWVINVVQ